MKGFHVQEISAESILSGFTQRRVPVFLLGGQHWQREEREQENGARIIRAGLSILCTHS
jgi:hypothetical protein